MLSIACLLKDTQLQNDLRVLVQYIGYSQASVTGKASLRSVYEQIRSAGIEVDLRTIGAIYADVLPTNEAAFNSQDEIDKVVGKNYTDLLRAIMLENAQQEQTIGEMPSEEWVVHQMAQPFYSAYTEKGEFESDMVAMQKILLRGAKRFLGELPKEEATQENFQEVLNRVLSYETMGVMDMNGRLNNLQDLFNYSKTEIDKVYDGLDNKPQAAFMKAQLEEYFKEYMAASYSLMFSKGEAKTVLVDIMKEAGFGKQLSNGKSIIDWVKLAGYTNNVSALRDNIDRVLLDKGYSVDVVQQIKNSLEREFNDLVAETLVKSEKMLDTKLNAVRKPHEIKSDLKRLSELNVLGIFQNNHDALLHKMLGVDNITANDMRNLAEISQAVTDLTNELTFDAQGNPVSTDGKDFYAGFAFSTLKEKINDIVTANVQNKTAMLNAIDKVNKFMQLRATGLIMNPINVIENNRSGFWELLSTTLLQVKQQGWDAFFRDKDLFKAVFQDVAKGGVGYGDEGLKFANIVNVEHDIAKKDNYLKRFLHIATFPARNFLSGSDSAFKAVITNKIFQMNLHQALREKAGMTKDEANEFMNEALYGQKKADAQKRAKEILDKYNLPNDKNAVVRLANDLVKANLNSNQAIDHTAIEAAMKSAYHVAAIGMGHEAQTDGVIGSILGATPEAISGLREKRKMREKKLIAEGKTGKLATHKAMDVLINNIGLLFIGSQFNWIQLRLQATGLGIVTGYMGSWKDKIDFEDKETLKKSMTEIRNAQQQMARGIVGLTTCLTLLTIAYAIAAGIKGDDDKDLDTLDWLYLKIKGDYELSRLFKKNAPELMILQYNMATSKNVPTGTLKYMQNFFNLGDGFSASGKLTESIKQSLRGETDEAQGQLGSIVGGNIEMPLWRAYKGYYQLFKWGVGGDVSSDYKKPDTFVNGVFGGGMVEDLGWFKRQKPLTSIPGIGPKTLQRLKDAGITTPEQFKKADWQNIRNEKGHKIFDKKDREKIDEFIKQY